MLAIARQSAVLLFGAVLFSPFLHASPAGGEEDSCIHLLGYGGSAPVHQGIKLANASAGHGGQGGAGGQLAAGICAVDNARLNRGTPFKTNADFVPVLGDDSLGFYCVYGVKASTAGGVGGNVGIYLFDLSSGEVLMFGSGYGNIQGANLFDAAYDMERVDQVIRFCMGKNPATTAIRMVAPHGHGDHINPACNRELERLGYRIAEISFHQGDFSLVNNMAWTSADRALFRIIPPSTSCLQEQLSFASPLGKIWFFDRPGHTAGSIDLVIDVKNDPSNRFVVRGSQPSAPCAPIAGQREVINAHGNVELASTPPTVVDVSPLLGTSLGGTSLTITGLNFTASGAGAHRVLFDGLAAGNVVVVNDTTLTCKTPAGPPGQLVQVAVVNNNGKSLYSGTFFFNAVPTLTSLAPASGDWRGGTTIQVRGSGFLLASGTNDISFGAGKATSVSVKSDTLLTCRTPLGTPGSTVPVSLVNPNGSATLAGSYRYNSDLALLSLAPVSGSSLGGTPVTLTGTSFTGNGTPPLVTFDGVPATDVTPISDTSLSVVAPDGVPGATAQVVLTNSSGSASLTGFRYHALPAVASLLPAGGRSGGGTLVTLQGSGFVQDAAGLNQVRIGGIPASGVAVLTDSALTCLTPPGIPGELANVTLTNQNGTATLPFGFAYAQPLLLQALSPVSGSAGGGASVTLTGSGFLDGPAGITSVLFGGQPAGAVNVLSDTQLVCTAPANAAGAVVGVAVTNDNGTVSLPAAFRYHAAPTLLSIVPDHGHAGAFTPVTVTGTGFLADAAGEPLLVVAGFSASDIEVVNDTTLRCTIPPGTPGSIAGIVLANSNGNASLAAAFRYHTAPSLSSAVPASGSAGGQARITLNGAGFVSDDAGTPSITFGGLPATGISVLGDQSLRCNAPLGTPGQTVAVVVTNLRGQATLPGGYRYYARPTLLGASPARGSFQGGTQVTLTGLGFVIDEAGTNSVTFGGLPAGNLSVLNDTTLVCTSPPNALDAVVDIVLTNANGTSTLAAGFSYSVAPPAVALVTPSSGPADATAAVQVTGTGFVADSAGPNTVTFGGLAASNITVLGDTALTCVAPAGVAGTSVQVVVSNSNGSGQLAAGFRYHARPVLSALLPSSASSLGGATIQLSGAGFQKDAAGANQVTFGGVPATAIAVIDDTHLTCHVPTGPAGASVEVLVSNANGLSSPGSFSYHAQPGLLAISPAFGPVLGGGTATLTGSGFLANAAGPAIVQFGTRSAGSVVVLNDTTLTCKIPAGTNGAVDVRVRNDNGSAVLGDGFRYGKPPPVVTSIEPSAGSIYGKNLVTLHGTGFLDNNAGLNRVKFGEAFSNDVITVDDQTVLCGAPPGTAGGVVDVALNNNSGTSTLPLAYRYFPQPTLLSASPSEGRPLASTRVTLTGTGFVANAAGTPTVLFGRARARNVVVLDDAHLVCTAVGGSPGARLDLSVQNENGAATLSDAYHVLDGIPGIRSVDPSAGAFVGGTSVTIEGSAFSSGVSRVSFDNAPALSVVVVDDTHLSCVTPPGTLGKVVNVALQTENGAAAMIGGFQYVAVLPKLLALAPADGPASGSTRVTLSGTGFAAEGAGQTLVTFDGLEATEVVVLDDTTVNCISPAGLQGASVAVRIQNEHGFSELPGAFRYHQRPRLTSIDPTSGPAAGGKLLTLTGTGFQVDAAGANLVLIGGILASDVNRLSDTTITCTVPPGIPGTTVSVQLSNRNGTTDLPSSFRYRATPTLISLSPARGAILGGTSVTLTGSGFLADAAGTNLVTFGGATATNVVVVGDTSITCTTPPGAPGAVDVVLTNANGSASRTAAYTYFVPPSLASLTPARGPAVGGTSVTLVGSGFQAAGVGSNLVLFGGVAALDVLVQSDTSLTCTTPSGLAGNDVDVTLTNGNGTATLVDAFHYHGAPVLASLAPADGPATGGTSVALSGSGFLADLAGANQVTFGGIAATSVVVVSDTSLTCSVPAGTPGASVDVVLANANGSSTLPAAFRYHAKPTLTALAPAAGPRLGGTGVTLGGTGFLKDAAGTNVITFGGTAATNVVVVSDTSITCTTPAGTAGTADVVLANANGGASLPAAFTYFVPPTLAGLAPARGPAAGGTSVTLNGSGFLAAGVSSNLVLFGGMTALDVIEASDTQITCTTPPGVAGTNVDVQLVNENGSSTLVGAYHYHGAPVLASLAPNHGPATGSTSVTLSGSGFLADLAGANQVSFGGIAATSVVVVSDTSLTCNAPAGTPGAVVDVRLTNANGTSLLAAGFRYHAKPTLTTLVPASGPSLGGTSVTLTGTGFANDAAGTNLVNFGGVAATNVVVVSDTSITCTSPAGTAGAVDVTLANTNGAANLPAAFAYFVPPTLVSLTPARGPATGGTSVTLNGSGFLAAGVSSNLVLFGGMTALDVIELSDTQLTCTTPPGSAGTDVDVQLVNENGTATRVGAFHYHGAPALASLAPNHGPATGGTNVSLTGSGFSADLAGVNQVTFGGIAATSIVVVSDTSLTCNVPAGTPGAVVDVRLTNANGASTLPASFRYHAAPTLTALAPVSGPSLGGTSVALTGTGFLTDAAGTNQVTFGGVAATNVVVVGDTSITCSTPAGSAGALVDVRVSNANGARTLLGAFRYHAAPTLTGVAPALGSSLGGTAVTLTGTGFQLNAAGTNLVTFGGVAATNVVVVGDTSLTCSAPPGTPGGVVDVRLANANGQATALAAFRYNALPTIAGLAPAHGSELGGTLVTLTGSGFSANGAGACSVLFGATPASNVSVASDSSLSCTAPAGAGTTSVDVRVSNANGSALASAAFRYDPLPIVSAASPAHGSSLGGPLVVLAGSHLADPSAGATQVTFGGLAASAVVVLDDTQVQCVPPAGAPAAVVDVRLTNAIGSATLVAGFRYHALPVLSALTPNTGSSAVSTAVTLSGAGFQLDDAGSNSVLFGATAATNVLVLSDGSLSCDVAPQPAGTSVDVTLSNANGTSVLLAAFAFDAPQPTLASIAPASGISTGGTPVTLTGSGFLDFAAGTNTVTFGGAAATGVVVAGDSSLECVTPPGTPGTNVDVAVSNANGTVLLPAAFDYFAPAPVVASLTPASGKAMGGGVVTLTGSGFQASGAGTNTVTFDGLPASGVVVIDDTTLSCSVPAGVPGSLVDVGLGNANGSATLPAGYRYHALPVLTSISPTDGTSLGGSLITVRGSGFLDDAPGANVVLIDNKPASSVVVFEDGRLTCRVPSGLAGVSVKIALANANGSVELVDAFRYHAKPTLADVTPASGPATGSGRVTVTGSGFLADGAVVNIVSFGGIAAAGVSVLNNTTLECNVPAGTSGLSAQVTVANVNGTAVLPNGYRYHARPTVTAASPGNGPEGGGTTVTLSGTGFQNDAPGTSSVTFGGVAASSVVVLDDTRLTCVTPAGAAGATVDVVLTNTNGTGTFFGGFQYDSVPVPLVTSTVPSKGSTLGSTQVTLLGSGFQAGMSVFFGANAATNVVVLDERTLTCITPAHAQSTWVDIRVELPEMSASLPLGYRYVAPPTLASVQPPIGLPQGGSMVVLQGTGFLDGDPGENQVFFGGQPAVSVSVLDDQYLVCEAPAGPALTDADVTITNDIGGVGLVRGFRWQLRLATDIDSDGRGDLILSSPGDDTVANDAGSVRVFFGTEGPFLDRDSSQADLSALPDRASMGFGVPVVSGDIDGDGHAELVIGASGDDRRARDAGTVFVFTGPHASSLNALTPDQASVELFSSIAGTRFGSALLLRDFDRDGILDLLVGAPGRTGEASLFLGSAAGLADQPVFVAPGSASAEGFASSLGAGDLDGDGWVDIVIGAPAALGAGLDHPGVVRVFRGGPDAFADPDPQPWLTFQGLQDGERFGTAVAVTDLSGDGIADLIVGAPSSSRSGPASGAVYVFFGRSDIAGVGQSDAILDAEGAGDLFGTAMTVGDVNGDGRPDLLLGAPGRLGTGRAYLFLNHQSFASATASEADVLLEPEVGSLGAFGSAVALVDIDGNGQEDIVVSAPGHDAPSSDAGRVYVFCTPATPVLQAGDNDGTVTGTGAGERLGRSMGADH